jgi:hypothetical protein
VLFHGFEQTSLQLSAEFFSRHRRAGFSPQNALQLGNCKTNEPASLGGKRTRALIAPYPGPRGSGEGVRARSPNCNAKRSGRFRKKCAARPIVIGNRLGDDGVSFALYFRRRRIPPFEFVESRLRAFAKKFPEYRHSPKRPLGTHRVYRSAARRFAPRFSIFRMELCVQLGDRGRGALRATFPCLVSCQLSKLIGFVRQGTWRLNHNFLLLAHSPIDPLGTGAVSTDMVQKAKSF